MANILTEAPSSPPADSARSSSTGTPEEVAETLGDSNGQAQTTKPTALQNGGHAFPPPKTDKPRPHQCGTCGRAFARLEHLKRHERSHTKEKPFQCPDCQRCFARRDLLLRHQQKLHQTGSTSMRPGSRRRDSASGMPNNGPGRIRKTSIANGPPVTGASGASMRPRAATISHIEGAARLFGPSGYASPQNGGFMPGHNQHSSISGLPGPDSYHYRGMSRAMGHHGNIANLPRIDTHGLSNLGGGSMRTAPPFPHAGNLDMDQMFSPASTVNPAHLHVSDSMGTPTSPIGMFQFGNGGHGVDEDDSIEWMHRFNNQMSFNLGNEQAIDEPSPSAMSAHSQNGFNDMMVDTSMNGMPTSAATWANGLMPQASLLPEQMSLADTAGLLNGVPQPVVSPAAMQDQQMLGDNYFNQPMSDTSTVLPGMTPSFVSPPSNFSPDSPGGYSSSMNGSLRQSSVTSVSTDSITDTTRQSLLKTLAQQPLFASRKSSHPSVSSPLSPGAAAQNADAQVTLPSTVDLRRYVDAYLRYFHSHWPFLHVPTLSFDDPELSSTIHMNNPALGHSAPPSGAGCLMLAMAACGALYECEAAASKHLYESAKRLTGLYLEERRRSDMSAAVKRQDMPQKTPLWLVQTMMLNVIYGHNADDKRAADSANQQCAALISLARAAGLHKPYGEANNQGAVQPPRPEDVTMTDDRDLQHMSSMDLHTQWLRWKVAEERKRTLYAIFNLSSILVTAYNSSPAVMNSEILLDLPCNEALWQAESAQAWAELGGATRDASSNISFSDALTYLLTASSRIQYNFQLQPRFLRARSSVPLQELPPSDIKPSTFGCLVLINALHNYIWETRQRHLGRPWTTTETESMLSHVEPALLAWQAAWASDPTHSTHRPNPHGNNLSADSIPLLDLAFVRLYVSMGRSKEAFFQRDFDSMAEELARGQDFIQHADQSPSLPTQATGTTNTSDNSPNGSAEASTLATPTAPHPLMPGPAQESQQGQSKRERHLRKAACYATDSLLYAEKMGVSFADLTSRELPIVSAMCTFDCAQVLAEWIATIQERVGRYLGMLGRDDIDFSSVPAIMLVEEEDVHLVNQINEWLDQVEAKVMPQTEPFDLTTMEPNARINSFNGMPSQLYGSFGAKILRLAARMLERSQVWPIANDIATALDCHAEHMQKRAEASLTNPIGP